MEDPSVKAWREIFKSESIDYFERWYQAHIVREGINDKLGVESVRKKIGGESIRCNLCKVWYPIDMAEEIVNNDGYCDQCMVVFERMREVEAGEVEGIDWREL